MPRWRIGHEPQIVVKEAWMTMVSAVSGNSWKIWSEAMTIIGGCAGLDSQLNSTIDSCLFRCDSLWNVRLAADSSRRAQCPASPR